jgi:serine/threonine protein kinase
VAKADSFRPVRYGDIVLLKPIARGGMAEIYLAQLEGAGGFRREVIVKQLLPKHRGNEDYRRMLLDEARIAGRLSHPNIVQMLNCSIHGETIYLVLEYVRGPSVRRLLDRLNDAGAELSFDEALHILLSVLSALSHAHTQVDDRGEPMHIIHRDVTPENILLTFTGEVKLIDFGVARATGRTEHTRAGTVKGKLPYLSPEQLKNRPIDHRLDQYTVGLTACELFSGERVFNATGEAAIINQALDGAAARLADQPALLRALGPARDSIMRALQFDADARFESCGAMARELAALTSPAALGEARELLAQRIGGLFGDMAADPAQRAARDLVPDTRISKPPRGVLAASALADSPAVAETLEPAELSEPRVEAPAASSSQWLWGLVAVLACAVGAGALMLMNAPPVDPVVPHHAASRRSSPPRPPPLEAGAEVPSPASAPPPVVASAVSTAPPPASAAPAPLPPPNAAEKTERPDKATAERPDKVEKPAAEKVERVEKAERSEKADRADKAEKIERSEKADKVEKVERSEKADKSEKAERSEKADKAAAPPATTASRDSSPRPRPSRRAASSRRVSTAPAVSEGSLDVACLPWCEIAVNGIALHAISPLRNHRLPAGTYDIQATNPPTGQTATQQVVIKAGEHTQVQFRW